ncbi:MAG: protein kinase domain-containing protein [Myxococcota bacterium]
MAEGIPGRGETADPLELIPLARLGEGSYGVVYRARDRATGADVALKVLRRADPATIARFKREFRALADVHHPNLVTLHRLAADRDRWLFSMEYVPGVNLLRWVWLGPRAFQSPRNGPPDPPEHQHARLRDAVLQIGDGLTALHHAGHLHRDLKPSNILVTPEGRVVILDFGLVDELTPSTHRRMADPAGSPAYMSPEQSAGAACGEASDWYSVGTILFEALTGRLPFDGPSREILLRKQTRDAPNVRMLAPEAPENLATVCNDLLARVPDRRPPSEVVRARLSAPTTPTIPPGPAAVSSFVGRGTELRALEACLRTTRERRAPAVARIHGASGVGKSALLHRFAAAMTSRRAVVLSGRCYEQEAVPYKGMDGVIDALAQYLQTLSREELSRVLPADVGLLAISFPVLAQLPAIAGASARQAAPQGDPGVVRDVAFRALAQLLGRIAERRPVVAVVDDVHWGDADSAALLDALLHGADAPAALWILAHREDADPEAPMLAAARRASEVPTSHLALQPLSPEEARDAARARLGGPAQALADAIARESGGMPLFLTQLAERARTTGRAEGVPLAEVIAGRIRDLPSGAPAYLEALAVFGRPVPRELVAQVAGTGTPQALPDPFPVLRAARLARAAAHAAGRPTAEVYHDRVRELVLASLPPDRRRALHARWAEVLDLAGWPDHEDRAIHLEAAGARSGAAVAAGQAADRAAEALAWDRAERLYARAGELGGTRQNAERWQLGRARSLANAGRGPEAARAYLALASAAATGLQRVEWKRLAAEQLLRSGRMDDGFELLREVLEGVDLRFPRVPATALAALFGERMRLKAARPDGRRAPGEVDARDARTMQRIDACLSAGVGLSGVDTMRAAYFQSRGLRLAVAAGEPHRIARALAFESVFHANRGRRGQVRARALMDEARRLGERLEDPYVDGLVEGANAIAAFHVGDWQRSVEGATRAEAVFRDRCTGAAKEAVTVGLFAVSALAQLGRFRALGEQAEAWLADARRRGDVYATTNLRTGLPSLRWLAQDQPDEAERQAAAAMAEWRASGFLIPDFFALLAETEALLYRGEGDRALARLGGARWPMRWSLLPILQVVRVLHRDLIGRASLARHAATGAPGDLDRARRMGRALRRESVAWSRALGDRLSGIAAAAAGDVRKARHRLVSAAFAFDAAGMAAHAATARMGLAALGDGATAAGAEQLEGLGVRRPDRFGGMHLPGLLLEGTVRWPSEPPRNPARAGISPPAGSRAPGTPPPRSGSRQAPP